MSLADVRLTDLMAELRERLRRFAAGPPGLAAGAREPGALDRTGRLALTARVLAAALAERSGDEARTMAAAFGSLAESLDAAPTPLEAGRQAALVDELVEAMEELAHACDRDASAAPASLWARVRAAGDRLWAPTTMATTPDPAPAAAVARGVWQPREVWLLVAGGLRRSSLTRRLRRAGITVEALHAPDEVLAGLRGRRPDAVICDDAAPDRHFHRLRAALPPGAVPVVMVQGRGGAAAGDVPVWNPPYRLEDLAAALAGDRP